MFKQIARSKSMKWALFHGQSCPQDRTVELKYQSSTAQRPPGKLCIIFPCGIFFVPLLGSPSQQPLRIIFRSFVWGGMKKIGLCVSKVHQWGPHPHRTHTVDILYGHIEPRATSNTHNQGLTTQRGQQYTIRNSVRRGFGPGEIILVAPGLAGCQVEGRQAWAPCGGAQGLGL